MHMQSLHFAVQLVVFMVVVRTGKAFCYATALHQANQTCVHLADLGAHNAMRFTTYSFETYHDISFAFVYVAIVRCNI